MLGEVDLGVERLLDALIVGRKLITALVASKKIVHISNPGNGINGTDGSTGVAGIIYELYIIPCNV